ncbi:hypothetical protein B14911_18685 [Bacillus sp. NRRL B-14911]|uniref:Uncharacterized protein n=1 Tax=Bacillus infantis NRRL B-14911 TaxID=1367477 RepID=U5L6R3_9BACI|nr:MULTISPECIES: hypothetical protein [Bacillus]AGX02441.1 hypothetical protein N288_02370 [Bacillus infantis NRRL B-14911]EAR67450.1 hypothetical protein B14911_18685 [Bacillus sp. NRRL B-14911]
MKKYFLAAVIAILGIAFWYYSPKNIHRDLTGLIYQLGEAENGKKVNIKIDGQQRFTMTGDRIFEGTIEIEGQSISVPPEDRKLELKFDQNNSAHVSYVHFPHKNGISNTEIIPFGQIHAAKSFSRLTIQKFNKDGVWTGSEGMMIAAPADNWKEAIRLSDDLIEEYQLNGNVFMEAKTE